MKVLSGYEAMDDGWCLFVRAVRPATDEGKELNLFMTKKPVEVCCRVNDRKLDE